MTTLVFPATGKQKILIVDDTRDMRTLISLYLKKNGYEVFTADCGRAGIQAVDEKRPDLILLDVMMPDMTGDLVCRNIRDNPWYDGIYIIMVTAKAQKEAELLNIGADDFISKPFDPEAMLARVRMGLKGANQKTVKLVDDVTGLIQPDFFKQNMEIEITRAQRYRQDLSLAFINIDNFEKKTGDKPEEFGNGILTEVADLVQLRKSDTVTRNGCDYIFLLPAISAEGAAISMDRIRKKIADHVFADGVRLTTKVSIVSLDQYENLLQVAENYLLETEAGNEMMLNGKSWKR